MIELAESRRYVDQILPHYSLRNLMEKHYNSTFIDYLFMDIEGDEFEVMKDLIGKDIA